MWLLDEMPAPRYSTICNFINKRLKYSIKGVFAAINRYIFKELNVDLSHIYIDGTKIEANANKYTWVWKKSCIKNREKVFQKITELIHEMNEGPLKSKELALPVRTEYAVEYVEQLLMNYKRIFSIKEENFVSGKGKHKSIEQRQYQQLKGYLERLKTYAKHIAICGEHRNSYSKTDTSATFMRVKRDYMGNDQLLPAYNMQIGVSDEFIAVMDVQQYASDQDCFVPLMNRFNEIYGKYPEYPVADAGYGSFNNYLYCEEHGMGKYMKFTMYDKTVKDDNYRNDPFRAVNFKTDEEGHPVCPNGKRFNHFSTRPVKGNKYGRTEELFICESCEGCSMKEGCTKAAGNRIISMNNELAANYSEALNNLESLRGALLRMNRSIQAEGTFGGIKWNRHYKRAYRRGLDCIELEFLIIACGYNIYKYHNKKMKEAEATAA